jgi:hypothetical protein
MKKGLNLIWEELLTAHRENEKIDISGSELHINGGSPEVSREVINLIKQMVNENSQWGAPRIHGEL